MNSWDWSNGLLGNPGARRWQPFKTSHCTLPKMTAEPPSRLSLHLLASGKGCNEACNMQPHAPIAPLVPQPS